MRFLRALLLPILLAGAAAPLAGQARPAELQRYSFITDSDDADALWVNPGALALRRGTGGVGDYVFDNRIARGSFRQIVTGFRISGLAFGYRHDEFPEEERLIRSQADEYRIGLAAGDASFSVGGAFHWHRVATRASAWDIGAVARPSRFLSVGLAWRDVGSPELGGVVVPERFVGGVSVRPFQEYVTVSWQGEYGRKAREITGHMLGAGARLPAGVELFGHLDMDRRGRTGAALGVRMRGRDSAPHLVSRSVRDDAVPNRVTFGSVSYRPPARAPLPTGRRVAAVTIGGAYVDFPPEGFSFAGGGPAIQPILAAIAQARLDPEVRGLVLRIRPLAGSFIGPIRAVHEELRRELLAFRESGKPIVAFLDGHIGEAELLIASAATEIVAPRLAMVALTGVHFELQRLRGMFERFGIEWDASTAGEYKSTFHTQYTDRSTPAQSAWIDGLVERAFEEAVTGIAAGRNLAPERVRELMDAPPLTAEAARTAGYLDSIGDYEDAEARVKELAGARSIRPARPQEYRTERWGVQPTIVVINAHGAIVSGPARRDVLRGTSVIGSETLARQIRSAADVRGARAIVLRINSPGGSAVASDEILAAIRWVRTEKELPVFASLGDIAASGGYWIAMHADTIVAERLTVTGSIGVVGAIPVIEQLLDTLRVNTERWQRGRYAGAFSVTRHRDAEEMAALNAMLGSVYDVFLEEVASGRNLPVDSVRALAEGRVWFGADALPAGLVDELGGLRDAVRLAAQRTGSADDFRVVTLRRPGRPGLTRLFRYTGLQEGLAPDALLPASCTVCLIMDDRLRMP
jgi:protease IV